MESFGVSVFGHVAVECPAEEVDAWGFNGMSSLAWIFEVQRLLGVCPQHDVLWEELSCEEHLQLFAGFKGVAKQAGASAVHAGKLSGGMKRKLSLGIAFIGGSRLVVLDEPTSGLDPFSRRSVWELLRSMKFGAGASAVHAGKLSGGMKRKLSLGIAFIGGSRLVVLDEPTSGKRGPEQKPNPPNIDALKGSRRGRIPGLPPPSAVWERCVDARRNAVYYWEHADILGDRTQLQQMGLRLDESCGWMHWKQHRYNVTFVKKPGCDADAVREAVCHHVPELTSEVVTLSNSAKELILQFPFTAARHFPKV
ncbi:ABC transporter A family member 9 [Symbiodinium microadriaticum]|uniref:ABC transporter A family member 9 n=1 Tax=Symbiodinium microadriaticum TaxID=2951 RepID=A0A1Q9E1C0_SYMMI|nr:ABC transporter A family member 9 [Symbiodinium microadriaticum]